MVRQFKYSHSHHFKKNKRGSELINPTNILCIFLIAFVLALFWWYTIHFKEYGKSAGELNEDQMFTYANKLQSEMYSMRFSYSVVEFIFNECGVKVNDLEELELIRHSCSNNFGNIIDSIDEKLHFMYLEKFEKERSYIVYRDKLTSNLGSCRSYFDIIRLDMNENIEFGNSIIVIPSHKGFSITNFKTSKFGACRQ